MKPENWNDLSKEEATKLAEELLQSQRGRYLVGQALAIAATVLEARDAESNIEEMEMLGESLFKEGFLIERERLKRAFMPGGDA